MSIVGQLGDFAGYLVPFLFVLSIVVFFHELGHFLVGRWCGVKVDAFSIGFGPELLAFVDRKQTRWRIAALPLGGYVKFHGDANGASVPDAAAIAAMSPAERAVSFFTQAVWKRARSSFSLARSPISSSPSSFSAVSFSSTGAASRRLESHPSSRAKPPQPPDFSRAT